jgi:hypothetical protein
MFFLSFNFKKINIILPFVINHIFFYLLLSSLHNMPIIVFYSQKKYNVSYKKKNIMRFMVIQSNILQFMVEIKNKKTYYHYLNIFLC